MLLSVLGVAAAHVPHDVVWALAAPRSLDASMPWIAVYASANVENLLRSDDGGATWAMFAGDPLMDDILDAAMLDDGTAVLLTTERWWWSIDGGGTWTEEALPGAVEVAWATDVLYLAGADGVWRVEPGGAATHESAVAVRALGPGPVAVGEDDHVYRRAASGAWSDQGSPGAGLTAAAWGNGRLYAGSDLGEVWVRQSGAWRACAALPAAILASGYPDILNLAAETWGVVVTPAWRGPLEGTPGCTGWRDRSGPPDSDFGGSGGPESVAEAFTSLAVTAAGSWLVSGWAGLWRTDDRGVTWVDPQIIFPDYTRRVAFSPDFATDGTAWLAPYAAAVSRTLDAGATVDAPAHGLSRTNVQRVYAPTGAGTGSTVYAVVNYDAFVSYDAGAHWSAFATSLGGVAGMAVWEDPDHVWALNGDHLTAVWETTDGGATWTELSGMRGPMGGATVIRAERDWDAWGTEWACLLGQRPVTLACSDDGGVTWSRWYTSSVEEAEEVVLWPAGAWTRLLFVDDDGLHATDDGGATWTVTHPGGDDLLVALVGAPDGTLFAATASGWLLRSPDGGDTWEDLGLRAPGHVYQLLPRPDFAGADDLVLATHDGVMVVRGAAGAAPTLERWADVQRVDDRSEYWSCVGCGAREVDADASMDRLTPLPAGAVASFTLRGSTVRVYGTDDGTGGATLAVDGVTVAGFGGTVRADPGELVAVSGLGDGVHAVTLTGTGGAGLRVDAVAAEGGSAPLALDVDGDGAYDDGAYDDVDCDDGDPAVFPGAPETWYDGVDQDCSGGSDFDRDGDGYDASLYGGTDCRDAVAAVNPGVAENPATPYDDNCNRRLTD